MSNLIEPLSDALEECSHCQMHKVPTRAPPGGCIPGPMPHRAGNDISPDAFQFPLVEGDLQTYNQLYVVTDVLSNVAIAAPTPSVAFDSPGAVEVLWHSLIYPLGMPAQIRTDPGPQFVAECSKAFCKRAGAIHPLLQAGRHQSKGKVEIRRKVICKVINVATTLDPERTRVEVVKEWLHALHCLPGPTGYSPYQLMTGGQPNPLQEPAQGGVEEASDVASYFQKQMEMARLAMEAARKVHEEEDDKYNRRRGATIEYAKGHLAWVKRLRPALGGKDHPYWLGPFMLVCQVSQNSYSVQFGEEVVKDIRVDQLCTYVSLVWRIIPLEYTRDLENVRGKAIETPSYLVREILGHRTRDNGDLEFRMRCQGITKDWNTWEPFDSFVPAYNVRWRDYVNQQGLKIVVAKHLPPPKNPNPREVAVEEQKVLCRSTMCGPFVQIPPLMPHRERNDNHS